MTLLAVLLGLAVPGLAAATNSASYPEADLQLTQSATKLPPAGGAVTVEGEGADPGSDVTVYLTLPSTFTRATLVEAVVGGGTAAGDGSFSVSFTVPSGLPAGTYNGAIVTRVNTTFVRSPFQIVIAAQGGTLPTSGSDSDWLVRTAGLAVVAGAAVAAFAVRRRLAAR